MDELEISGKRYLSSKRAAKEQHYHPDYIGQLIRAGKVTGTKVGRGWYVEADSLQTYLATEASAQEFVPKAPLSVMVQSQPVLTVETERVREQVFPVTVTRTVEPEPMNTSVSSKPNALRYIADDEPLFPLIQKTSHIYDRSELHSAPKVTKLPSSIGRTHQIKRRPPIAAIFAAVFISGIIAFTATLLTSAKLFSTIVVESGKPASVGFSF